jgi:hypothetical protein
MAEGYGSPGPRLFDEGSLRPTTKWIQARQLRESLCCLSHPEIAKQEECLKTLETPKGETAKRAQEGYVDSPKNSLLVGEGESQESQEREAGRAGA